MLKKNIAIEEANGLLFAVAKVLSDKDRETFYNMVQDARTTGEPRQIVDKVFEAIFHPGVVYPE